MKEFDVNTDIVFAAPNVLKQAGLITVRKGHRTVVRPPQERKPLPDARGSEVVARMPTPDEQMELDIEDGVPVLEMRRGDTVQVFPADAFKVRVPR